MIIEEHHLNSFDERAFRHYWFMLTGFDPVRIIGAFTFRGEV